MRPIAWLCEIQASGNAVITKVLSDHISISKKEEILRQRGTTPVSTSIFDDASDAQKSKKSKLKQPLVSDSGIVGCFHEDGGRYAEFQRTFEVCFLSSIPFIIVVFSCANIFSTRMMYRDVSMDRFF